MTRGAFLAGDWGTTHLRAWRVGADGEVLARRAFSLGVARLAPGEAAARFEAEVRPALEAEGLPALLCGMVGSNLGWLTVPYLACPAALADLAGALGVAAPGVRLVPGLTCDGLAGPDVLRGEETQALGWLAAAPGRRAGRHLLCLPGTHAKWIRIDEGRVERFVTAMTGELFELLESHSLLRSTEAPVDDAIAFDAGVAAAGDGGALTARLFGLRGRRLAGELAAASSASFLSGLLIGAEIAALHPRLADGPGEGVSLIGDPALCARYARILAARGVAQGAMDGETAALAGLTEIRRRAA